MATVEEVSLYLNLATTILNNNAGSLEFLTGNTNYTIVLGDANSQNQETQCLSVAGRLWIANNNDADSTTQRNFIIQLGISTKTKLLAHVDKYLQRVLGYHGDNVQYAHQNSGKRRLLFQSNFGMHATTRGAALAVLPGGGICNTHSVGNALTVPPNDSLLMIIGQYQGDVAVGFHAEQKLIAAFGKYVRAHPGPYSVTVGGNKTACATCAAVLADASLRLAAMNPPSTLTYTNAIMDRLRGTVGLGADDPAGIRRADLAPYFT